MFTLITGNKFALCGAYRDLKASFTFDGLNLVTSNDFCKTKKHPS